MNITSTVLAIAAATLLTFGTAGAQTASAPTGGQMSVPDQDKGAKPMPSQTSRAEVKAEAKAARAAGTIVSGERSARTQASMPTRPRPSAKTRAEVRAEAARARKAGEIETGQRSVKDQDRGGVKP